MVEANAYLRGQYLIASETDSLKGLDLLVFDNKSDWNGYSVLVGESLPTTQVTLGNVDVFLIGYLVHHKYQNFNNEELLTWLVNKSLDAEDVVKELRDCGGRYIALIRDKATTIAVTDCCAMRQLYWYSTGNQLILSSSARLILDALGQKPQFDEKISELIKNPVYSYAEYAWYGDKWYDNRINKIIANHYLDMNAGIVHRTRYHYNGPTTYPDIIKYAAEVLTGLIGAVHHRYHIIQPLTAGYDSRLLLAASRNYSNRTSYYIFDSNYTLNKSPDVMTANDLCKKLGLKLSVIMPGNLRKEFIDELQKKCFIPRILPKATHIQWHYDIHRNKQILNINGNCGEIARYFYQYKTGNNENVNRLIKIAGFNNFFEQQIKSWYEDAIEHCRRNNINVYDMFYWEQRMSNWGAIYPFDQDIAIEEFTPYNHSNLLLTLLKTDIKQRKGPQYALFRDLMQHLWPETLSLPFNPIIGVQIKARAKRFIKRLLS